jgi:vacuolar protein sorting-associated protein 51
MSSSDDDSDDDSDDEFLASANDGEDREALVTKRLLQNFYGKAIVGNDDDDDDEPAIGGDDRHDELGGTPGGKIRKPTRSSSSRNKVHGNIHDLDSPAFDANLYAINLIRSSTTHDLLETEERLALSVRNLDSTMQTLVYENYSKFIDATDAIHTIGVNVQANEAGLRQLTESMGQVAARTRTVDAALGSLRDQVADKIRVQRLLTRLDALLKLPKTLELHIQQGLYQRATKSYLNAVSILAKQSEGFESLKSIESQCKIIMKAFDSALNKKIVSWSGKDIIDDNFDQDEPANIPRSIAEVLECSGALNILVQEESMIAPDSQDKYTPEDLMSMTVTAAMRYLDRQLDSHLIQVQERRFGSAFDASGMSPSSVDPIPSVGLIPADYLVSLLEGVRLFLQTFGGGTTEENCKFYISELVAEAFEAFLSHARSVLLEENARLDADDEGEALQKEISLALTALVQHVQEFEAGLIALGVVGDSTTNLVDQTLELTESMVRRRVDQKFQDLRQTVVQDCLVPFAANARAENEKDQANKTTIIAQVASSMLSDCMQLVDDSIRSIYLDTTPDDRADLKDAVHKSTLDFATWLANAFEILAGEDPTAQVVVAPCQDEEYESDDDEPRETPLSSSFDDDSLLRDQGDGKLLVLLDEAREQLLDDDGEVAGEVALAITELCRQASESVPQSILQSFKTHMGESAKKKSVELFPGEGGMDATDDVEQHEASRRFKAAVSLVFFKYIVNHAEKAVLVINQHTIELASLADDDEDSSSPSNSIVEVLALAKNLFGEVSEIFEEGKCGGPIPVWKDSENLVATANVGRKTGLYLDVERIFKEQVIIYPHPSNHIPLTATSALFLFLKVVIQSLIEYSKMNTFTSRGYEQAAIDFLFLKQMIPHYFSDKEMVGGVNCCSALRGQLSDFFEVAQDRCANSRIDGNEDGMTLVHASEVVQAYLSGISSGLNEDANKITLKATALG